MKNQIPKFLLIILCFYSSHNLNGQNSMEELIVKVSDAFNKTPIKGVKTSIRELGYTPVKKTDSEGTVYFESVPFERIEILIEKFPEYYPKRTSWIVSRSKGNNVVDIELQPIPINEYLFFGRVVDDEKNNIDGLRVILRVGNIIEETYTNEFGAYFIDIKKVDVDKIKDYQYSIEVVGTDFVKFESTGSFYPQFGFCKIEDVRVKRIPAGLNSVFLSIPFPGLGQNKVQEKKRPYYLMGIAGYTLLGTGVYMNWKSQSTWDEYLKEKDSNQLSSLKNKSNNQQRTSKMLYGAAALIWLTDISIVLVKGNKNRKQRLKNQKFGTLYSPSKESILFSYTLNF